MKYLSETELENICGETGRALACQRKVTIVLCATGSKKDAPWEGGLNGYFLRIRRGVPVEVPEAIAELVCENERVTELARDAVLPYKNGRGKKLSA